RHRAQHLGRVGGAHPADAVANARRRSPARGAPHRLARHVAHGPLGRRPRGRDLVPRETAAALHRPARQGHAALLSVVGMTTTLNVTLSFYIYVLVAALV